MPFFNKRAKIVTAISNKPEAKVPSCNNFDPSIFVNEKNCKNITKIKRIIISIIVENLSKRISFSCYKNFYLNRRERYSNLLIIFLKVILSNLFFL